MDAPLIITLELDAASAAFFNTLRQHHFPPERNFLNAHLTLFHHLPSGEPLVKEALLKWSKQQATFSLPVTSVVNIGNGVAYKIESPLLVKEHQSLQKLFLPWLTAQDRQVLWPHITVQNKVPAAKTKALQEQLAAHFVPFEATATGLALWAYKGGPWEFQQLFPFSEPTKSRINTIVFIR